MGGDANLERRLDHFLFTEHAKALDRYEALLAEDQAYRSEHYERPDPRRRRLHVACNQCRAPWCCNQRVSVELVEMLVVYRWAARHAAARAPLEAALRRGHEYADRRRRAGGVLPTDDLDAYFRRKRPCPFLVQGRCAIYPVRPMRCRVHYMAANPQKCRDELAPSETFALEPDPGIRGELARLADDVRFFALVEEVVIDELSEVLALIDRLVQEPRWDRPRRLGAGS